MVWLVISGVCFLALAAYVLVAERQGRPRDEVVMPLLWASSALAVVGAAAAVRDVLNDGGVVALALLLPPVLLTGALVATWSGTRTTAYRVLVWVSALVLTGWALLMGLGLGLVFLPAAIALVLAAAATAGPSRSGQGRHPIVSR